MNPTATPLPPATGSRPRRFRWRYCFYALLAAFLVLGVTLALSFRTGSEVRALRRAAMESSPGVWGRQIEFGVGRLPVWIAQAGLSFLPLEPEARAAIHCLQSADVGVYHLLPGAAAPERDRTFDAVRSAMEKQGWEPLVLVRDGRERVGLFVPAGEASGNAGVRVAIFVMDGSDLVLASVRADLEPLAEALAHSRRFQLPLLAGR